MPSECTFIVGLNVVSFPDFFPRKMFRGKKSGNETSLNVPVHVYIILQKEKESCRYSKISVIPHPRVIYLSMVFTSGGVVARRQQTLNFRTFHQSPRFLFPSPSSTSPWPQELSNSHWVHHLVSLRDRTSSSACALYPVTPGVRTGHCSQYQALTSLHRSGQQETCHVLSDLSECSSVLWFVCIIYTVLHWNRGHC